MLIDDALLHHSGVRHYVFDLVDVLRRTFEVDYLRADGLSNDPPTFDVIDFSKEYVENYGFLSDHIVGPDVASVLRSVSTPPRQARIDGMVHRRTGRRLDPDLYAGAVVYAPWCMDRLPPLSAAVPTALLNHDVIPNQFVLSRPDGPHEWAGTHARGIRRALVQTCGVLTISEATAQAVADLFPSDGTVTSLPIFLSPRHARSPLLHDRAAAGAQTLVLVGPLDPRKGLLSLPRLVSRLYEIERVVVIGESRVSPAQTRAFFSGLEVSQVTWIRKCREATRERALAESGLLLFPSDDEGLGLPLLEAQVLGLPVAVKDKPPMNELVIEGVLLAGNPDADVEQVRDALRDLPDRSALAARARQRWTSEAALDGVTRTVRDLLGV